MKFDLSQFKKVKEDDHTAVMQHPEGHHIVIAKRILSPEGRNELAKLPIHAAEGIEIPGNEDAPEKPLEVEAIPPSEQEPAPNIQPTSDQAGMTPGSSEPPPPPMQTPNGASGDWNGPAATNTSGYANFALPPAPPAQPGIQMPQQDLSGMQKAANEATGGFYGEAAGKAKEGAMGAKAAAATAASLQDLQTRYQNTYQQLTSHVEDAMKDYANGHINANHYVESMDSGKKTRTAIGLLLGGMGGGMLHQGNPALDYLNKQIDRDIGAQQSTMDQKKNLLGAHMQMFGNLRDATDMTKAIQMGILSSQFQQAGAASQGQIAKGIAAQHAGLFKTQMIPILQQMAWRNSLNNSGGPFNPEVLPPDMRERYVPTPGGGQAFAPTKADAEGARATISHLSQMDQQLKEMENQMNTEGRAFIPGTGHAAQAQIGHDNVVLGLGKLHDLNRMSDVDLHKYESMVPTSGDWNQGRAQAKIKALRDFVRSKMNEELSTHLEGFKPQPQAQSNRNVTGGYRAGRG